MPKLLDSNLLVLVLVLVLFGYKLGVYSGE